MMLFVAIAAYGILTAVMERINPFYISKDSSLHSIIESIQYMFGALLNQGTALPLYEIKLATNLNLTYN